MEHEESDKKSTLKRKRIIHQMSEESPDLFKDMEEDKETEEEEIEAKKANVEEGDSFKESLDIFNEEEETQEDTGQAEQGQGTSEMSWRGARLADLALYKSFSASKPQSSNSTVFVQWPPIEAEEVKSGVIKLRTHPKVQTEDRWDERHVRMPFSNQSLFPLGNGGGRKTLVERWNLVVKSLTESKIESVADLQSCILSYNNKNWHFDGLFKYVEEELEEEEQK